MPTEQSKRLNRREFIALRGMRLPLVTLQGLQASGIYCVPTLSVEYQRSATRHVIRAQESGGAVAGLGAYCGFVDEQGNAVPWLQRVDTLGVNGIHARTVATSLVRIQVVRVLHTYDLLLTKHALRTSDQKAKPSLENAIIFYGRQGTLELDLWGKDDVFRGTVFPVFYNRGGDPVKLPSAFESAVRRVVAGVCCCGCKHTHVLVPPESSANAAASSLAVSGTEAGATDSLIGPETM